MKKFYLIALFTMVCNFASAQFESVAYRGAFAPAPTAMWTDSWTDWDPKNTPNADAATVVNITTDITANTTWVAGTTYKISGLIYVRNNATLTIQPGVTVKGVYTTTGTALVITKGAKLNAIGTAAAPIVFTSAKTVAEGRSPGDWGGVILLGKARFTSLASGNTGVNNIEGITASVNTEFGGGTSPIDTDSSGVLKYVRIEFGGFVFSNNNEINGLTFGAVGSGTTIDYVQVSYSNDDSFEWFGGAVNCKHLVAYRGLDDDFDTDNGFKGSVQFALGIKDPTIADNPVVSNSEGFESDNNPGSFAAQSGWDNTSAIFSNCTLIGPSGRTGISVASGHERPLRLRRNSQLKVYNSIFMDFKSNYLFIDGTTTQANAIAGTLKFKNNIIAGVPSSTYTFGVRGSSSTTATAVTELASWFSANNNSYVASAGILTSPYDTSNYTNYNADTTTIDYRPGTLAASGASFTDSSIVALVAAPGSGSQPTTVALSYCKGTKGVPSLTAILSATGVSLKWYTAAIGGTASTIAPIPSTSATKTYYVSELDASNVESARTPLTVTILAIPTIGLGSIKGVNASTAPTVNVGLYLGTTTEFSYSVATSTDPTVTSYLWTVPAGVNITSGQGTNTITINYANVPQGAGDVGTISVQGLNASLCGGTASILKIKKALAAAPTLKMYDKNSAKPTSALTSFGQFAGTSTPVTLVATPVATATSYQWELPTGVSVVTGSVTPIVTTITYTAEPFLAPTTAPTTVGTKYWVVTYSTYNDVDVNGVATKIVVSTAVQKVFGTTIYGGITTAPYLKYGTVITSDLPSILVSFAGVGSASKLYLGVKSVNGVGASITNNNTDGNAVDIAANVLGINYNVYTETTTPAVAPSTNATSTYAVTGTTPSTAKLLKLVSVTPAATSIKSLNGTTSVTDISTYVGTTKVLTLAAKAIANASSYTWTLPSGVNQLSGGTTNVITVNYAGIALGTSTVIIAAKANNNVGSSVDATLTLTAAAPATVAAPIGTLAICPSVASSVTYTIAALAKNANTYNITLPAGATIAGNSTATIDAVANAAFTVDFASGFVSATLAPLYITIQSENGFGVSAVNRSLKLTNVGALCGARIASTTKEIQEVAMAQVYPNPTSGEFTVELSVATASNATMTISSLLGNVVSSRNITLTAGNNVINENISSLTNGVYIVTFVNATTGEVITKKIIKE